MFGWGHTQSDDVKAKKSAPAFLQNVQKLLRKNDVVIADKKQPPKNNTARNCANSHPTSNPAPVSSRSTVLWMFLNTHEELTPAEVDASVDLELNEDTELEDMVGEAVDGLFKVKALVGEGGPLEGVEKPDAGRIREVVDYVVGSYQVQKNVAREKANQEKDAKKVKKQQGKPPRYFGLAPELNVQTFVDSVFSATTEGSEQDSQRVEAARFYEKLKAGKRVTDEPHITIVHKKQLPQDQDIWDTCVDVVNMDQPPKFECKLNKLLTDGRVMVLVVDTIQFPEKKDNMFSEEAWREAEKQGKEFVDALQEETKNRLHVTVGTENAGIMPVEGKMLVERWKRGERGGVSCVEFEEKVVGARLRGMFS
ncbi:hypothetical protein NP233_g2815 [Leucocoprinus birnbaumii]|uniref:tRNA ligase phosphodiesterase domain-containing protein n=1 Tax=Leucocoprinus birnbaumii TaxID=56174 RepID=A0AAD5VXL7_9AGAR|nr:hypothetical protein NP233_g2815 [Leucocoprinus birnbaumii]